MKKVRNAILILSTSFLLAGCGGGGASSSLSTQTSSSSTSSPSSSSSQTSQSEVPTWNKNSGSFSFKSNTAFPDASSLPEVDHVVAFCPVSSNFTHVYLWEGDGDLPTGSSAWPGVAMEKYNADWYKVDLSGITKTNIIFNKNGSPQTQDMSITHAGYWYFWNSDANIHDSVPSTAWVQTAKFVSDSKMLVVANKNITSFKLYEGETVLLSGTPSCQAIDISLNKHEADLSKGYHVECVLDGESATLSKDLDINALYGTASFDSKYCYSGSDLGLTYSTSKSGFKVWSPFSSAVTLRLYESGTPTSVSSTLGSDVHTDTPMSKGEKGVWSVEVAGDLNGKYYTYIVTNSSYTAKEAVDPYAKAVGVNGKRAEILDLASTDPAGWSSVSVNQYDRKSLAVWECHIADLSSSPTWNGTPSNAKRYAGFHEEGTTYTKGEATVKTGFDHVKELGVNAVQILPMFDQDNDETNPAFNWGYNPLNYNAPEGVYSSNPYDGATRIKELKSLIADYTKSGINIIMDVVYNHVASAKGSNFDVLVPGYYFRYTSAGAFSNGSGCGNETASDHYMMRKFMVDSATYWAKEYKLGGFRFDLMGLHDLTTMEEIAASCKKINPSIAVYGEPWTGGSSTLDSSLSAKQINGNKYVGYGAFNDVYRDALIKGGLNDKSAIGWADTYSTDCSGDIPAIVEGIKGYTKSTNPINDPDKTVNYVTCHDNYTLYDRVTQIYHNAGDVKREKSALLAESLVFTSQGTSFMLSGDEFLRTKGGNSNSYNSSYAVNTLNYALKVDHLNVFEAFKKLIALKTKVDGLHLGKDESAKMEISTSGGNEIVYTIKDSSTSQTYKIAHGNAYGTRSAVDFSGYSLYLDTLNNGVTLSSSTPLEKYQTIIGVK